MPTIHLTSFVEANADIVFDLSRNISLQRISFESTGEEAIAGTTSGLIGPDEMVTWKAKRLFMTRFFTAKITEMKNLESFTDKMIKGDFISYQHQHFFKQADNGTIIIDIVKYELPYGLIGKLIDRLYMRSYIEKLIRLRNETVKKYAESDKWHALLGNR